MDIHNMVILYKPSIKKDKLETLNHSLMMKTIKYLRNVEFIHLSDAVCL
jgi:hypothetical protein